MNKTQITLYCEQGIKIFSKNPDDVHQLKLPVCKNKNIPKLKKSNIEERFLKNNEDAKLLEEFIK